MANSEEEVEVDIDSDNRRRCGLRRQARGRRDRGPSQRHSLAEALAYRRQARRLAIRFASNDTPENFGRIAAQTAKQVVLQRIRDYERETVYEEYRGSSRARSSTASSSAPIPGR